MFSITLQNNFDNQITANDTVGQLQFAAPYEFDGGAAVDIVAKIYANGEGGFQSSSNPTSIIIATAAADASAAVDRVKVSEDGHFLPVTNNTYDLGSSSLNFKNSYISEGVVLASNTPSVTTNKLYNEGGTLKFNGSAVGGGGTPGGSDTHIQYNDAGSFGGVDKLTYNSSTNTFTVNATGLFVGYSQFSSGVRTNLISSSSASSTKSFDISTSPSFRHTLGAANTTLSVTNGGAGHKFTISLTQDGTGSRTVTWWSNIKWPGGLEPTLTTTAGKTDVFGFIEYSTSNYYGFVIGYGL